MATNSTLNTLVIDAYQTRYDGVTGGPEWAKREFFEVEAKAERPFTGEELRTMLQNLLADRFQLRIHREMIELPVYQLVVDKGGLKMTMSSPDSHGLSAIERAPDPDNLHEVRIKAKAVSMKYMESRFRSYVDRPVIDMTGLPAEYDFDLTFAEDVPEEVITRRLEQGRPIVLRPTIFEALRQQLGLRLVPGKGPVETIVIDRAERPTAN